MDFGFTDEQEELRRVARDYLAKRYPPDRVAALADSAAGYADDGWTPVVDLGWLDPALGMVELSLLAEESGYALHPVPWWSAVALAVPGSAPATQTAFAWYDDTSRTLELAATSSACRAVRGAGWRLTGTKRLVVDLASARAVTLNATTDEGVALFTVEPTGPAVTVVPRHCLDGLRRESELRLSGAPATLAVPAAETPGTVRRMRRRALVLLAAEAAGVARRAFDIAADHAKIRTQFGRPIGSYQAVAFAIADCYATIELARSLVYRAACVMGSGAVDTVEEAVDTVEEAVSCAVVAARDAAVSTCEQAIQVLGGIGMTWEHPIHRWYRRALWLQAFDAGSAAHRDALARRLVGA